MWAGGGGFPRPALPLRRGSCGPAVLIPTVTPNTLQGPLHLVTPQPPQCTTHSTAETGGAPWPSTALTSADEVRSLEICTGPAWDSLPPAELVHPLCPGVHALGAWQQSPWEKGSEDIGHRKRHAKVILASVECGNPCLGPHRGEKTRGLKATQHC